MHLSVCWELLFRYCLLTTPRNQVLNRIFVASVLIGLFCYGAGTQASFVAVSDTKVVLTDEHTWAEIDLISSQNSLEYAIEPYQAGVDSMIFNSVRWAPRRMFIAPNSIHPLRIRFDPTTQLPDGEYKIDLRVRTTEAATTLPFAASSLDSDSNGSVRGEVSSAQVAFRPSLRVSIILLKNVDNPQINVQVQKSQHAEIGEQHFLITKEGSSRTFAGYMKIEETTSGRIVAEDLVLIPKAQTQRKIRPPGIMAGEQICLKLWASPVPTGKPQHKICME